MGSLKRFNSLPSSALSSFHFSPPHSHYPPGHLFPRGPEPPTCRVPCPVETRRHETRRKRSIEETLTVDFSHLQTLLLPPSSSLLRGLSCWFYSLHNQHSNIAPGSIHLSGPIKRQTRPEPNQVQLESFRFNQPALAL